MSRPAAPMPRAEAAELLGVAWDATATEVQRAFLRAARYVHPDTLPEADDAAQAAAARRFDALTRARAAMLAPRPEAGPRPPTGGGWAPRAGDPDGPRFRPVPGRGLGGSLVVLALLAFLLVGLVSLQDSFRRGSLDTPPPASTSAP